MNLRRPLWQHTWNPTIFRLLVGTSVQSLQHTTFTIRSPILVAYEIVKVAASRSRIRTRIVRVEAIQSYSKAATLAHMIAKYTGTVSMWLHWISKMEKVRLYANLPMVQVAIPNAIIIRSNLLWFLVINPKNLNIKFGILNKNNLFFNDLDIKRIISLVESG